MSQRYRGLRWSLAPGSDYVGPSGKAVKHFDAAKTSVEQWSQLLAGRFETRLTEQLRQLFYKKMLHSVALLACYFCLHLH